MTRSLAAAGAAHALVDIAVARWRCEADTVAAQFVGGTAVVR
jgi:hypothetical protein